jgi:hypothetical protein
MNIDKLSVMLCLGFQESDGPFNVIIKLINSKSNRQEIHKKRISKEEIKSFSDNQFVISIDIAKPIDDRRSKDRWKNHRRKYMRNLLKLVI